MTVKTTVDFLAFSRSYLNDWIKKKNFSVDGHRVDSAPNCP